MQSNANLLFALCALAAFGGGAVQAQTIPADPPDPTAGMLGPRGSSQPAPGEQRYDAVGYAVAATADAGSRDSGVVATHANLPVNSYVEVTALDSGRTILVLVAATAPTPGHVIALSSGAFAQLGQDPARPVAVRVRLVNPPPQDKAVLRAGGAAQPRIDAPEILLRALRKELPSAPQPAPVVTRPPVAKAPTPAPRPPVPVRSPAPEQPAVARRPDALARPIVPDGRYMVQVAALSSSSRAQALAQSLGGSVKAGGGLFRVQLGPFATTGGAQAARTRAARAGYGDARILPVR